MLPIFRKRLRWMTLVGVMLISQCCCCILPLQLPPPPALRQENVFQLSGWQPGGWRGLPVLDAPHGSPKIFLRSR
jgi:hypothetical protein